MSDTAVPNLGDVFAEYAWKQVSVPENLWHYTDAVGLIGIANSKTLWCSDYRHLNDKAEMSVFTAEFIANLGEELKHKCSEGDAALIILALKMHITVNVFVGSFCTENDRNEHWHQYAKGAGYAVGFDLKNLHSLAAPQGFILAPVIYGAEKAKHVATSLVKDPGPLWQLLEGPLTEENRNKCISLAFRLLLLFAPLFKPAAFESEKEWRLVKVSGVSGSKDTRFRPSKTFGVLAYNEFKLKIDDDGSAPSHLIPRVVVGPGNQTEGVARASNVYELLEANGFETLVSESASSLRMSKE
jgi:hypothetical protein